MKSLIPFTILLSAPVAIYAVQGAEVPSAFMGIPADGERMKGESVQLAPTPEFLQMQQHVAQKLAKLPQDKQQAFLADYNASELLPYSPDFWATPAEYEAYKTEWSKIRLEPLQPVQMGAYERGDGKWGLQGFATNRFMGRTAPLAISGMVYNAATNEWQSSNGVLKPQPLSTTTNNVYGARKGTTWLLEKKDSMSVLTESLSISRRMNGEFIYLHYRFSEHTPSGTSLAQNAYVLRFRVGPPAADPPEAAPTVTEPVVKAEEAEQKPKAQNDDKRDKKKSRKKRRKNRRRN